MNKAVLISIQPQWCEKIASGEKTLEIRKTKPKLRTPFKCYIYCTKSKDKIFWQGKLYRYIDDKSHNLFDKPLNGKVIGKFVCDRIEEYQSEFVNDDCYEDIRLVWDNEYEPYEAEKEFEIITSNEKDNPNDCRLCKDACLTFGKIKSYVGIGFAKTFYGWHISDLVIYDKPKEIGEFYKPCIYGDESDVSCFICKKSGYKPDMHIDCFNNLTRSPQSWCYVQED